MPQNPDWLGSEAAAHHLGITPHTLYRLIDQGQVAGYRFGRVIRLRRATSTPSSKRPAYSRATCAASNQGRPLT